MLTLCSILNPERFCEVGLRKLPSKPQSSPNDIYFALKLKELSINNISFHEQNIELCCNLAKQLQTQ